MEKLTEWSNSECFDGWLHKFKFLEENPDGLTEMCQLCNKVVFFPNDCDNISYLSWHLREALQPDNPLFSHEHPEGFKYIPKKTSY